ncbi:hypothetical protein ACSBR2_009647 [Camellia fascicularis]
MKGQSFEFSNCVLSENLISKLLNLKGNHSYEKSQSHTPVSVAAPTLGFPMKKLERQLDFTGFGGTSVAAVLLEHPQQSPVAQPLPPPQQQQLAMLMQS